MKTHGSHAAQRLLILALLAGCGSGSGSGGTNTSSTHAQGHPHEAGHEPDAAHDHDFSDAAGFAALFDDPARDAWQQPEEVVLLMEIEPGMSVVDLGAGTGYFLGHLVRATGAEGKVLGLDVEPNMVRHMQDRIRDQGWVGVEARTVAPDDVGLEARSVDRILIVNTWHHLADRPRYARHLATTLKRGGSIWIVDFTVESDFGPPRSMRIPPDVIVDELEQAGLKASLVEETLPNQFVVRAAPR